jgi:hypothetical protein
MAEAPAYVQWGAVVRERLRASDWWTKISTGVAEAATTTEPFRGPLIVLAGKPMPTPFMSCRIAPPNSGTFHREILAIPQTGRRSCLSCLQGRASWSASGVGAVISDGDSLTLTQVRHG